MVAITVAILSAMVVAIFLNANFTPAPASAQAEPIDRLLRILFSIGGVIFVLCLVLLIYSVIVFRHPRDTEEGPPLEGNYRLELTWTLIPLAIVLVLAVQGAAVLKDIGRADPKNELEIKVTAFQWAWRFEYPQYGITSGELRLPVNRPVLLKLTSLDVIHAFWVPQFRVKQDAVPGMEKELLVTPTRVGSYKAWCNQLCGLAHAAMQAPVIVVEPEDFELWVKEQRS
ncbi:MAG: cytochrome c oxidase subunit II [Chloroflexi bacterium]|nr:cytochrome c oxidase subunit II [Chloroflexota bacterium]